jgi:hypothetical protein
MVALLYRASVRVQKNEETLQLSFEGAFSILLVFLKNTSSPCKPPFFMLL